MSHKKIIAENSPIFQYLLKLNFTLYFTIPVLRHIMNLYLDLYKKVIMEPLKILSP
jgi:hypothetical protein